MKLNFNEIIPKFDSILSRGLCSGLGDKNGQMCIEAAICASLNLPHGDQPPCVTPAIIRYKITLNDAKWSSPVSRAKNLRALGIAQIGSLGIVNGQDFVNKLQHKTISILIPDLFDTLYPNKFTELVNECRSTGDKLACRKLAAAATDVAAAAAATYATVATYAAAADVDKSDKYLIMSANLALEVLKELKSPGCDWI